MIMTVGSGDQDHSLEEVQMRNLRSVIFGLGCLLAGVFLANYFGAELGAQQDGVPLTVEGGGSGESPC